jgi:hypothetical protein
MVACLNGDSLPFLNFNFVTKYLGLSASCYQIARKTKYRALPNSESVQKYSVK